MSGFLPSIAIGSVRLPTYFLIVSLAFIICLYWLVRRAERRALARNTGLDLSIALMIGGLLGARAFHVIFEEPAYYAERPSRILEIWAGGFVWYGGALFGALGFWTILKLRRQKTAIWLDVFAPLAAFGYGAGRIACVLTGCCYGRWCELANGSSFRYPTQAFAVCWEFAVLGLLIYLEKNRKRFAWLRTDGQIFLVWLVSHAIGRLVMEAFRDDPRGPAPWGLSVSSWISLALLVIAVGWLIARSRRYASKA